MARASELKKLKSAIRLSNPRIISGLTKEFIILLIERAEKEQKPILIIMKRNEISEELLTACFNMQSARNRKHWEIGGLLNKLQMEIWSGREENGINIWVKPTQESLSSAHEITF